MNRPHLETARLILRMAGPADVPRILRFQRENQEHLRPWSPIPPVGWDTAAFWKREIERYDREFSLDLGCRLLVLDRGEPETVVGKVAFTAIVRGVAQFCFIGYHLGERYQGRGLMTEALRAAVDYAFDGLKLHRVMANYMPRNTRSARVLEKLGFEIEGTARGYLRINGVWEDHVLTSLTNPRWVDP